MLFFFMCCFSGNTFKVAFFKAVGHVRAAQSLFLSPTVCAAGCFTVDVQALLDSARIERTDSESNEHEGEMLLPFDLEP